MHIHKLRPDDLTDFKKLIAIFNLVFEQDQVSVPDHHLIRLLEKPDFMAFVIKSGDQVVGGLTIYVLHRYHGTRPLAYIYDVGIRPADQGKGLGKWLIAEVCRFCRENGFEEAYVEAEHEDVDAVHFYRKTAYSSEMHAIHFTYAFTEKNR